MESLLCSPLVGKFVCAASFAGSTGVIHRAQALAAGMSPGAIQSRLESGEFVRILPRVYRDSSTPLTYQQRLMAAILWAGEGSCVSHRAAARLWKMDGCEEEIVEISCPRYMKSPAEWLVVHAVPMG